MALHDPADRGVALHRLEHALVEASRAVRGLEGSARLGPVDVEEVVRLFGAQLEAIGSDRIRLDPERGVGEPLLLQLSPRSGPDGAGGGTLESGIASSSVKSFFPRSLSLVGVWRVTRNEEISRARALEALQSLAAKAEHLPRLGCPGGWSPSPCLRAWHLDLPAQRRASEADRKLEDQVLPLPREERMRDLLDVGDEVARRAAATPASPIPRRGI